MPHRRGPDGRWCPGQPIEERFWAKVDKRGPNECWAWIGNKNEHGYGIIATGSHGSQRLRRAHRVSFEIANGPIPSGMHILHSCDNPPCVNPAHLRPGTQADNIADMMSRGRNGYTGSPGERHPMAKLSAETVEQIRADYAAGGVSYNDIVREFGISKSQVARIINNQSWVAP